MIKNDIFMCPYQSDQLVHGKQKDNTVTHVLTLTCYDTSCPFTLILFKHISKIYITKCIGAKIKKYLYSTLLGYKDDLV